jgi:hypothetical protein
MTTKRNHSPWTLADVVAIRKLAARNTPTGLIAYALGRSENAIYQKASELGVSLHPTNKRPYNRLKR